MSKFKKYINKYKVLAILLVAVCLALVVKKTFSANENVYTREQLQKMVVSAAISYYYNNYYSDYEQRLLDSDIKYPSVSSSNNSCTKVSQDTIKNNTSGSCESTSTIYKLYSTTFYRNTKITPEEVSRSNQYNVDCTGLSYLIYNNVLGYDLSEFYRLSITAKYTSIQKQDDGTYVPNIYVSNSTKARYNKTINKFSRVWNSAGNLVRVGNCIVKNDGDRTKCMFDDSTDLTSEYNKYNNGGEYAPSGRKYVDTSNKSEIVYSYIFKDDNYEEQFETDVLPYFDKENSKFLMQPGDMLDIAYKNSTGHVMIYIGNTFNENDIGVIHATGVDQTYDEFGVRYDSSIHDYLEKKKYITTTNNKVKSISVYRPVNKYCSSNTCTNSNITSNDKARVIFSGTRVEQYVEKKENNTSRSITKYNSVDVGDTITYGLNLEDKRNYGYCSDSSKTKSNCPTGEWKETGNVYDNSTEAPYYVEFIAPKGVTIKSYPQGYKCIVNNDKTTTCTGSGYRFLTFDATINSDATSKLSAAKFAITYKENTLNLSTISIPVNNTINYNDINKIQETINNFKQKNYTYSESDQIQSTTNINNNSLTKMSPLDYIKYIYYNTFNIDLRYLSGEKIINSLFYTWDESYGQNLDGVMYTYNPTAYFKKDTGTDEVNKMLVEGMYGGKKLIGNENSSRIKFIHPKYFEPGDIIVVANDIIQYFNNSDRGNMNFSLTKIDPSKDLKYYLVTGFDGEYTILTNFNENNVNSCGKESVKFSEDTNKIKNNILNNNYNYICSFRITKHLLYSSNLFAVLRPTQLYNDISYNVTVHLDDNNQKTSTLKYNDIYTEKISSPTKSGYNFDGWYYDKEYKNKATRVNTHTNHDIYAKYSPIEYTLTIDLSGGVYNGDTSIKLINGETYTLPTITKEGYIFDSWQITGTGSSINGNVFTMGNENTTVKAIWKREPLLVSSNKYIINDNDIKYMDEFNIDNITINYGTKEVSDNKLIIKDEDKIIKEYNLVKINVDSSKYIVNADKISYFDAFDENNITISNCTECTKSVDNNKLIIKYNDKILKEYDLVKINIASSKYIINTDKILYFDNFDENDITINNCTECTNTIVGEKLIIKYNDKTLKEYTLAKIDIEFNEYNVIDENLLHFNDFDTNGVTINNCTECTKSVENNKLIIKYKETILKSYNLLGINSEYKTNKNTIYVEKDSDEVILTKLISSYVDLSIDGDKLIVKYNDTVIKTFNLSRVNETFNVKDYKVNNDKYIISGIMAGTNLDGFKSKIEALCQIVGAIPNNDKEI